MAVRLTSELAAELRGERTVIMRVRSTAAAQTLDAAMVDIRVVLSTPGGTSREVDGPAYVSEAVAVPDGRLLMVDFGHAHPRTREDLPQLITAALERHGVTDAVLEHPPEVGDRYEDIRALQPVVRTWLRWDMGPDAPRAIQPPPTDVVDLALNWLWSQHQPEHEVVALAITQEVPLTRENHRAIVDAIIRTEPTTPVYTTDFTHSGAMALLGEFRGLGATLAAAAVNDFAAHMRAQRDLIRDHAHQLSWAGITVLPNDNLYPGATHRRFERAPASPMWYQLLTAGQAEHLGDRARARTGTVAGRTELELDAPELWSPNHSDHQTTLDNARRLLGR